MKQVFLSFIFFTVLISAHSQRYLTPIFSESAISVDIAYGISTNYLNETEDLLLDFYEPVNDPLEERPLLIYVHGGGFTDVNQSKSLIHIVAYCDSMARRGYAVASINYRLDENISNRAVINAMHDAKAAVRFFRANASTYKIDPDLIFMGGESAGAVTSLTTTYIDEANEVNYPPTLPLSDDLSVEGNSGNPGHSSATKAAMCLCGGTETTLGDLLFDTLSIQASMDPPLLISHGTADQFIHISKALEVAIRANNISLPYLFYTFDGATHCPWFFPLENSWLYLDTMITQTTTFLHAIIENSSTGIADVKADNAITIYPNPTKNFIIIEDDFEREFKDIQIIDPSGMHHPTSFKRSGQRYIIGLDDFSPGVYYIRIIDDNDQHIFTSPIVKTNP